MKKINIGSNIKIYWKIWRGANKVTEDFNSMNTNLKVFLVGSGDTYCLEPSINNTIDPGYDVIELDIPAFRLDVGVYNIKAIWEKNGGRNVLTGARASVLYLTDSPSEAPIQDEEVRIVSLVENFGRDGMSAYETAVMRGVNEGITSEIEWVKSVSVFNEKERLANEEVRMANEAERIANEADRIVAEKRRELFKEGLLDQVNNYKPIEITGDVTNAADEEDITSDENNLLKLKDRTSLNGMGYKILRMDKPLQEQMSLSNTIYEIRYNFDLEEGILNIPEHCILKYNGGSFTDGHIVYNDTTIEGAENMGNITFEGEVKYFYDDRFDEKIAKAKSELNNSISSVQSEIAKSISSVQSELSNIADDEDLIAFTDVNGEKRIGEKNREATEAEMGYIILRKTNKETGQQLSFGEQLTSEGTIYEIRYDFDLNKANVKIPKNSILKFNGGSVKNGTIVGLGNNTIYGYPTYNIFNDTIVYNFDIPFFDVRWFGAIPDCEYVDEGWGNNKISGTDNATYFERAINACVLNVGSSVKVVGKYAIKSTIEVRHDLNLIGEYYPNRTFFNKNGSGEEGCPSLIAIPENVTAFKVVGWGDESETESRKSAQMFISNIKVVGNRTGDKDCVFIDYTAIGGPTRVGKVEECLFEGLTKVLWFHEPKVSFKYGTIYGNLTIAKVFAYECVKFIVAESSSKVPTLCNLIIKDSTIEQNESNAISLHNMFGAVVIDNNILENSPDVIDATFIDGSLTVSNNYFESQGGDYLLSVSGSAIAKTNVSIINNYINNNSNQLPIIVNTATLNRFYNDQRNPQAFKCTGVYFEENMRGLVSTDSITGAGISFRDIQYGVKSFRNQYDLGLGEDKLSNKLRGKSGFDDSGEMKIIAINDSFNENDVIILAYYADGEHEVSIFDGNDTNICAGFYPTFSFPAGMVIARAKVTKSAESAKVRFRAKGNTKISNGYLYKNIGSPAINQLGVPFDSDVRFNLLPEYANTSTLEDKIIVGRSTYDGLFFSDGKKVRNSDGSLFEKVEIVSKYNRWDSIDQKTGVTYKIVGDIDLQGDVLAIKENVTLDFTSGGSLSNGTLSSGKNLRILPNGCNIEDYIKDCTVNFNFAEGQFFYDPALGKPKWRSGGKWVNAAGEEITQNG